MKEKRFKLLLNLYLDHELSPVEQAELEDEVLRNPDRRRVYHDYCRIQKGCVLLFDREVRLAPDASPLGRAIAEAGQKMERPPAPSHSLWWRYAGGVAAMSAACITLLVFIRTGPGQGADPSVAESSSEAAVYASANEPEVADSTRDLDDRQLALAAPASSSDASRSWSEIDAAAMAERAAYWSQRRMGAGGFGASADGEYQAELTTFRVER